MLKTVGMLIVVAFVGLMVSTTSELIGKRVPFIGSERIGSEQANHMNSNFIAIDFKDLEEANRWYAIDDVVMGGVSQQSFEPVFRGRIVENASALAAERIQKIGFLLADKHFLQTNKVANSN